MKYLLQWSCLLVIFLSVVSANSFSAKEFFLGEWELEFQRFGIEDHNLSPTGILDYGRWRINDANETLVGEIVDEKDEVQPLSIEFDSEITGRFQLAGNTEDETDIEFFTLFQFDFTNRSSGVFISQGSYSDQLKKERGVYHFIATSPASFVMTVYIHRGTATVGEQFTEVNVITGKKTVEKKDGSFWSRLAMPVAVCGVFVVMQFLKGRGGGTPAAPADAAGPANASAPANPAVAQAVQSPKGKGKGGKGGGDKSGEVESKKGK